MKDLLERVERVEPESAVWLRILIRIVDPYGCDMRTVVDYVEGAVARLEQKEALRREEAEEEEKADARAGRPANPWAEAVRVLWADAAPYALPDFNEEERRFQAKVFKAVREVVLAPLTVEDAQVGHLQLSQGLILATQSYVRGATKRIDFYMHSNYKCSEEIIKEANAAAEGVLRAWKGVADAVNEQIYKTWSDPSAHERPALPVEGSKRFRVVFNAVKNVVLSQLVRYLQSNPVQAQLCRTASDVLLEAVKAGWQGYFSIELRSGATTEILHVYAAALDAAKAVNGDRDRD